MTAVDVSQLQDGSFVMDQKTYVDNIEPADIKPERRKTPEASVTEREKTTLRGLWRAMQWPCTQTDAKSARAVSMLHSSRPVATVGTLMKSNQIPKEMKSDLAELRVQAHRDEKLAVVFWSDAAWANRKDLSTLCDSDSSSFWKIEKKSQIEFERRGCTHWLTQNKSYTSRDCKWQSLSDYL